MKKCLSCATLLALVLSACSGASTPRDSCAVMACHYFRQLTSEARKGILDSAEIRTQLKTVYESAACSTDPKVADAARQMLAAITATDAEALKRSTILFTSLCAPYPEP